MNLWPKLRVHSHLLTCTAFKTFVRFAAVWAASPVELRLQQGSSDVYLSVILGKGFASQHEGREIWAHRRRFAVATWLSYSYQKAIICALYQDSSISLMPSPGVFLCMSVLCLFEFSPCTLASSHTPKTCTWAEWEILNKLDWFWVQTAACISMWGLNWGLVKVASLALAPASRDSRQPIEGTPPAKLHHFQNREQYCSSFLMFAFIIIFFVCICVQFHFLAKLSSKGQF